MNHVGGVQGIEVGGEIGRCDGRTRTHGLNGGGIQVTAAPKPHGHAYDRTDFGVLHLIASNFLTFGQG
jgi:hypothetical protein